MHTRKSDEMLLIQFVEDQGFDIPELVNAAKRLKECHRLELLDYAMNDIPASTNNNLNRD